jgi:outer membrane protein, protease secretion system
MRRVFAWRYWLGVTMLCSLSAPLRALDLLESYEAALSQDADYQAARAAAEGGREMLPMARAQLFPSLSFNATKFGNDLTSETQNSAGKTNITESQYPSKNYSLTLRQPIYRPAQYAGYLQAKARVEGVEAVLDKAGQDLAMRVSGAYFNVLLAQETLLQIEAQGIATEAQLASAKRALEAGQGTRTDIDDAQARLDLNQARQLGARQQISQVRHELEILIGRPAENLRALGKQVPSPESLQPTQLDDWIGRAELASPELRDMRARVEAARIEVDRARAGHKPTLDLIVQKSISESDNVTNPNSRYDNNQVGVQLVVPLFAGGYVSAQVRQAVAALEEAEQRYQAARRKLATQVRKEFQGIQEGMAKLLALEVAERSAEQSLISNEKGFMAGTRSRIDILNASDVRASTRLELAKERLNYVMSRTRLLGLSGDLDHETVLEMNRWLIE